jgi:hypothetical protein
VTVIGWLPTLSELVVSVAWPLLSSVPVPMETPLSLKTTVPVGVMTGSGRRIAPLTVTVKVTGVPTSRGFAEEVTVIDPTLTNCAKAGEGMAPRARRPSRISQPFTAARLLMSEASFSKTPRGEPFVPEPSPIKCLH